MISVCRPLKPTAFEMKVSGDSAKGGIGRPMTIGLPVTTGAAELVGEAVGATVHPMTTAARIDAERRRRSRLATVGLPEHELLELPHPLPRGEIELAIGEPEPRVERLVDARCPCEKDRALLGQELL